MKKYWAVPAVLALLAALRLLTPAATDAAELLAPTPYDGLYRHYVEAQIHYANGEMERYNNACAAWNNALLTYRDFWCRSHMPRQGVKALRLM